MEAEVEEPVLFHKRKEHVAMVLVAAAHCLRYLWDIEAQNFVAGVVH